MTAKSSASTACPTQLLLRPRWTKRGYTYDVECDGKIIVSGARDPEHTAARVLAADGIHGAAETIDAETGKPRLRFDIDFFARTYTMELDAVGLRVEEWRPLPAEISDAGSLTGVLPQDGSGSPQPAETAVYGRPSERNSASTPAPPKMLGKNRARDRRETKALTYLKLHGGGSAVDIGNAAIKGEPRARKIPWRGKEAIGLSIAVSLAKRGMVRSTRDNRFKIAPG